MMRKSAIFPKYYAIDPRPGIVKGLEMVESKIEKVHNTSLFADPAGNIVAATVQVAQIFGYELDELLELRIEDLIPERFHEQHQKYLAGFWSAPVHQTMRPGKSLPAKHKDGHEFKTTMYLNPFWTEQGILVLITLLEDDKTISYQQEGQELAARLFETLEMERLQLAREIHDGPLQDLYAIYYQLTNPPPILQESALLSQWQQWKDQIAASLLQVTRELKFVGEGLLPPVLASYGLEVAIRSHLQQFKELHPDIQIEMELMPDEKALSQRTRLVLFRIYQHAVSNVIRHAHAKSLRIFFAYDRDQVVLEISDDGDGFEVPKDLNELARSGHSGLYGSVERVRALGGRFHIDSTPGRGTTLQVIIPRVEARHKRSGS